MPWQSLLVIDRGSWRQAAYLCSSATRHAAESPASNLFLLYRSLIAQEFTEAVTRSYKSGQAVALPLLD